MESSERIGQLPKVKAAVPFDRFFENEGWNRVVKRIGWVRRPSSQPSVYLGGALRSAAKIPRVSAPRRVPTRLNS